MIARPSLLKEKLPSLPLTFLLPQNTQPHLFRETMPSNETTFNFGPAVAFTGEPTPEREAAAALRFSSQALVEATAVLSETRAELAKARGELTVAKAAQAGAEKKEAIARRIVLQTRTMDDYERAVQLQEELDALKKNNRDARDELNAFAVKNSNLLHDVASKDNELLSLGSANADLKKKIDEGKQALAEQKTSNALFDTQLNKAYADLRQQETAFQALTKAKDDVEARAHEKELEVDDFRQQWQQAQAKIEELESDVDAARALERDHYTLVEEVENLRSTVGDYERTILVKDARIEHLEAQYQKALERSLNAEAAISSTSAPTDTPTSYNTGEDTLADELAAAAAESDDDDASYFNQLDLSDVMEVANIAPKSQKLSISPVQAISIAPVASLTTTSSTQTDVAKPNMSLFYTTSTDISPIEPTKVTSSDMTTQTDVAKPNLSLFYATTADISPIESTKVTSSSDMSVQTDVAEPNLSLIHITAVDIPPIEPTKISNSDTTTQTDDVVILAERKSQTAAAQTDISNPPPIESVAEKKYETTVVHAITQTMPVVEKEPEPIIVRVADPAKKKGWFTVSKMLSVLAVFLAFYLYAQLQAYKNANGYNYNSRNRYSTGAFGNGRYLFGIIPIGFDIGHDWFSEQVCRQTSTAIAAFEDWAGITPTPLY
jgi:predicted  nucleic acid-binding Zn-ribbon protein